ncbi:MAG: hypothetical protein AAF773_03745 [Cyanobacteria bacterium P01_D01_bin.115]
MPGLLFDGNKRRIYEVPGDTLGTDFTYTTDAQGFRIYVPIGQGPTQITFDAQRDIWSRFQEYFDQNKWTTIALTRSGGASRGFDDQGNEIFQTNDFTLDTPNGWRLVLANYDHETIFRGNLFSGSSSISLLDYSRITAIPPPRSRVSGFDALITYAIATGGSGGNFTTSDRQDLQQTLANTNTTNTRLTTTRAGALDLLQDISDRILNLFKGLGREPGVSVTQEDPTETEAGYLRTSDGSIDQIITRNPDGSVRVENSP